MRFPRRVAGARPHRPAARSSAGRGRSLLARWATLTLLPGLVGAVLLVGSSAPSVAKPGVDDYPAYLKARPKDALVDPWNFYSRECTSFVAWRLYNDNGVKNFSNRYLGHHWGDARIWKSAAVASGVKVDDTPAVGAVAWWPAHSAGSSLGHVAWVQKTDGRSVTIEEYNYLHRGSYDTRVIRRGDRTWPDGFIHVRDLGVRNLSRPGFSGKAQVGRITKASPGSWSRSGLSFHYQWFAGGKKISWATHRKIRPRADQLGKRLQVQVTATLSGSSRGSAKSAQTAKVAPGTLVGKAAPVVSGDATVGATLTATPGTWSPQAAYSYQWLVDGQPVAGAIASTSSPGPADAGHRVSVRVTATLPGYADVSATSAQTDAVAAGRFTVGAAPSVTGTPRVDQQLTAAPGTWSPKGSYGYQWYADGEAIPGATARTFTPGPAQVGHTLTVEVTATRSGYQPRTRASAATTKVQPGRFTSLAAPTVKGTPRVGTTLTVSPGEWRPKPVGGQIGISPYRYQWLADGKPIEGATSASYTPSAAQLDQRLSVQVTATRPGYTSASRTAATSAPVAPGRLTSRTRPRVTGAAFVGTTLTASPGAWSTTVAGSDLHYQWYADGRVIPGADRPTFVPTRRQVGQRIRVRVSAHPAGYAAAHADSTETAAVLRGRAAFGGTPRVTGRARLGRTLTAAVGPYSPPGTTPHYQWFRNRTAIPGATSRHYETTPRDLGRALSVRVALTPRHWAPATRHTAHTTKIRAWAHMSVRTEVRHRRVHVRVSLWARGVPSVEGRRVRVSEHGRYLGSVAVRHGSASRWLPALSKGTHRLTVAYRGNDKVARRTLVVQVRVR